MTSQDLGSITRRFLGLKFLHALSDGFQLPVKVLIPSARGLSLSQIGIVMGAFSLTVVLLELPTGGLADSWGRRRVLILGGCATLVGVGLLAFASTFPLLMLGAALTGATRALASGPLEAWYVDHLHARQPEADLATRLGWAVSVDNAALAAGSLGGGILPILFVGLPSSGSSLVLSLSTSLIAALVFVIFELVALFMFVDNGQPTRLRHSISEMPRQVSAGLATASSDTTILIVLGYLTLAGIGLAAFEVFVPLRLVETGLNQEVAATVFGVIATVGFLGAALMAPLAGRIQRRVGDGLRGASLATILASCLGMLATAPATIAVVAGYLSKRVFTGPTMPLISGVVHGRVTSSQRATLLSLLSLAAMLGAGLGSILLAQLADRTSASWALGAGGAALIIGAILLLHPRLTQPTEDETATPK